MKSASRVLSAVVATSLLALSACGDDGGNSDGGGASCGEVAACGGDPTGSWSIDDACFDASMFQVPIEGCDAELDSSGLDVSGHAEFRADGTYVMTATLQGQIRVNLPPACLTQEGTTSTCAQLDEQLEQVAAQGDSPFVAAECSSAGADCACAMTIAGMASTDRGTWSVSGSTLTTEAEGEDPEAAPFCAQGSSLTMGISTSAGGNASGPLKTYLKFTKE
ncbi:hypothetical protein WMF45_01165 [Sorangium sp. So ce448]|uniref:hypothetical protein n=1 Tax=Sorangium sp. So ce448 TaxID=3133314 RepID=UPI003F628136